MENPSSKLAPRVALVLLVGVLIAGMAYGIHWDNGRYSPAAKKPITTDVTLAEPQAPKQKQIDMTNVKRILFLGDSMTNGKLASSSAQGFAAMTANRLGVESKIVGFGDVGYAFPGVSGEGNFEEQAPKSLGNFKPDLVILQGGGNDVQESDTTLFAAAMRLLGQIAERFPGVQCAMLGPVPTDTKMFATLSRPNFTLMRAATEGRVVFVNPLLERWMNPADLAEFVTSSSQGTYLNTQGHQLVMEMLVQTLTQGDQADR
jgi:lysophospholipase L1-like esterase